MDCYQQYTLHNVRYFIFDRRVTAIYSCRIPNNGSVESACALRSVTATLVSKGPPFWDPLSTSRANDTNRLSRELDTSNGFLRPYSYDVMIAHGLKAFWYVYIIN